MTGDNGKHDHRELQSGETVYLTKDPGSKWRIDGYDCSWFEGQHLGPGGVLLGPNKLKTKKVTAQAMGWEDRRFDTEVEAYAFVEEHIRANK
jgi:hypothetical protein